MNGTLSTASFIELAVLLLAPVLPLLVAAALLPPRWRESVIRFAPWAALPSLLAAAISVGETLDLPWLLLGIRLGVDSIGQAFLFFTATLWLLAGVYARSYLAGDPERTRFFAFFLLTMSGNFGLVVAQDVLSFYLFFSLMSFASYGLIVHKLDPEARRAGRVYIYLVVLGEVLLFAGLVGGSWHAGSLSLDSFAAADQSRLIIGLLIAGFGIKAGALPLHVWLPLAHPVAPTPASAVLSGAMIKAGLLGWLRFLPLGQVALPDWSLLFIVGGLAAAAFGVLVGLLQDQPKSLLAYSSISQMGLMTAGVGVGMAAPEIWPLCLAAILAFAMHHAFAKGALFLGVGLVTATARDTMQRRWAVAGLLLPALALAGLPFTSGAVAKFGLKSLSYVLPEPWPHWLPLLLSAFAVGTTLLMARLLYLAWHQGSGRTTATLGLWLPWTVLLLAVASSIWAWPDIRALARQTLSAAGFFQALWPVIVGATGALLMWILHRKSIIRINCRIPAGDILGVAVWAMHGLERTWRVAADRCRQLVKDRALTGRQAIAALGIATCHRLLDIQLRRWETFGIVFVVILAIVFTLLALEPIVEPK